jgi:hypothetical protein
MSAPRRDGQVWDRQRARWVQELPEERVRQRLVSYLVESLGYPRSLILTEQALHQLPHLRGSKAKLPLRRLDILCYASDIHPEHALYPLLLIECKAVPLNSRTRQQVIGYNHYVGAHFLAIANAQEIQTGYFDVSQREYRFGQGLPTYEQLMDRLMLKGVDPQLRNASETQVSTSSAR